jgi:hypothetical protein
MDTKLRADFLKACRQRDLTAAQVLRAFMRTYVDETSRVSQQELFLPESTEMQVTVPNFGLEASKTVRIRR